MTDPNQDPIEELARYLRQGIGAEMRAEAEEAERESHQGRLRRRTMSDIGRECANRGDRVRARTAVRTVVGRVDHVGADYLTIVTAEQACDVRLDRCTLTIETSASGGHSTQRGSVTLKARLAEYEQTGEPVTIVCAGVDAEVDGVVAVAATDHVVVVDADDRRTVVPYAVIDLVVRPLPTR